MICRVVAWALAVAATVIAGSALLPPALPLVDALAALVPVALLLAACGLVVGARAWSSALALAALVVASGIILHEVAGGPAVATNPVPTMTPEMTVVVHNVGYANIDPEGTVAALASSGADVLLLQETDGTIAHYLAALRRVYPYTNTCPRGCSMAIFSHWPLTRVRWRFHDADNVAYGPALYTTTVRLPWGGTATLATLHLSRHATAPARAARREALATAVRRAGTGSMVLAGDFNLTPWGNAMRGLDAELSPMARATRAVFSFPARWQGRTVPVPVLPIDHLYAGPDWGVGEVRQLARTGSDHYPIRIKLLWHQRRV